MNPNPVSTELTISPWSPLKNPLFRALWIASVASNVGTWTQSVGEGWLMTTLTTSPLMASLIQTAESLPIFLLALPAGALADILNRKRVLVFTQAWMLFVALSIGLLTVSHLTTPWLLLLASFTLAIGNAVNAPAWAAMLPDIVGRDDLPQAIGLNSIGYNIARIGGPALGGMVVALTSPGICFLLNALSFIGVILVLLNWKNQRPASVAPAERIVGAMRSGVRYTKNSPELQRIYLRTGIFIVFASGLWSMLTVYARRELGTGSLGYGALLGCLGAGAIFAASQIPRWRRAVSTDRLISFASAFVALVLIVMSQLHNPWILYFFLIAAGAGWMTFMSSMSLSVQRAVPQWVRARALSTYLLVFQGGMALGGVIWGTIATHSSVNTSLLCAGIGLAGSILPAALLKFPNLDQFDFTPSAHWPDPQLAFPVEAGDGPVMVTLEYEIDPTRAKAFRRAIDRMGRIRRRDGAFQWGVFADVERPERFVEVYLVESWGEHLRQHGRITLSDRRIEDEVYRFQAAGTRPKVSHFLYSAREPKKRIVRTT